MKTNKADIIEHLQKGIQPQENFSFNLAIHWAKETVDLLKSEFPEKTEAIAQSRRVFGLKPYNGADYGREIVNGIYSKVIEELSD